MYLNFSSGFALADGCSHFIDHAGKKVNLYKLGFDADSASKWTHCSQFSDGWLLVFDYDSHKWVFIDKSGKIVLKTNVSTRIMPPFPVGEKFSEGLTRILIGNKWGFIDKSGKMVISPQFTSSEIEFKNGLAKVSTETGYGYIDKTGKRIWWKSYPLGHIMDKGFQFELPDKHNLKAKGILLEKLEKKYKPHYFDYYSRKSNKGKYVQIVWNYILKDYGIDPKTSLKDIAEQITPTFADNYNGMSFIFVDLNNDKKEDFMVYPPGGGFCGNGENAPCQTYIYLSPKYDEPIDSFTVFPYRPFPLYVLNTSTNGMRDIFMHNHLICKFNKYNKSYDCDW
jgi:hypothetical protein